MKRLLHYSPSILALAASLSALSSQIIHAGCCDHVTAIEEDNQSILILEARVTGRTCLKLDNGNIVTDVTIQPIEIFKGIGNDPLSPIIIRLPGGKIGNEIQFDSGNFPLKIGQDYIFRLTNFQEKWQCVNARASEINQHSKARRNAYRFLRRIQGLPCERHPQPSYQSPQQSAPTTEQSASSETTQSDNSLQLAPAETVALNSSAPADFGYQTGDDGIPTRFTVCDDGSPIEYIVDTEILPPGITVSQALQATEDALEAWSAVSGLRFKFIGQEVFGQAPATIDILDNRIRIQLHNKYNQFNNNSGTLGQGGGSWFINEGEGARVVNQEFHKRTRGYLSLNHVSTTMQNLSIFTEVLTHELGHVLGLAHSSENSGEEDAYLSDATMYYLVHADARGASIRNYDNDKINLGYPANNMPPYGMERIFYPVTASNPITGLGVDRLTVSGSDLETPNNLTLSVDIAKATSYSGTFSVSGSSIIFTPNGAYGDQSLSESDIDSGSFYDRVTFRLSDGINLSPTYSFRIVGFRFDDTPSDGLPNTWMIDNFGSTAVGATGSDSHPDSDPDGDGLSNRLEYLYGTDPNDKASGLPNFVYDHTNQSTSWNSIKYMPYYLESSPDLTQWTQIHACLGTGNQETREVNDASEDNLFYRLRLQP